MEISEARIRAAEVEQIVGTVFQTMLNMDAFLSDDTWIPEPDRVTATLSLHGQWTGAILIETSKSLANHFASRFLALASPDDREVRAVLGELANIIGGNLKCTLNPGALLSMPTIVDGHAYSVHLCGVKSFEDHSFVCDGGTFWVRIVVQGQA